MLAKSKYNSIEALISQALNDIDISYKKFITILDEKNKYERMKYNLISKNENEKQEIIKLNSILSKINATKLENYSFFLL